MYGRSPEQTAHTGISTGGMKNEAYFPAQEASAQPRPRFPEPHGYQERPQGHRPPPCKGPQEPDCLICFRDYVNKRVADCKIGSPFFKYGFTEAGIHYNICVGMPSPWGRCPWPRPRTDEGKPSGNFPQMGFDRKVCPHQPPAGGSFSRGRSLGRILLCVTAL